MDWYKKEKACTSLVCSSFRKINFPLYGTWHRYLAFEHKITERFKDKLSNDGIRV
jgi:hypothetical protein